MSTNPLIDAIECYKLTPERLTAEQITLIRKADPELGARARHARGESLGREVAKIMKKSDARITALEARLAALEEKPTVKFCGVWTEGRAYQPGEAATHQGGLWICRSASTGRPNDDHAGWTLAVKRGSAGGS